MHLEPKPSSDLDAMQFRLNEYLFEATASYQEFRATLEANPLTLHRADLDVGSSPQVVY